jgi:DnaK suppressor protein
MCAHPGLIKVSTPRQYRVYDRATSQAVEGGTVTNSKSRSDKTFLERQKRLLQGLRKQILADRKGHESESESANAENAQAREYEDDAQKLTALELQGSLAEADDARLSSIERALQKIDDGSYGLSDASGAPIPIERLEAYPDALYTLEEQASRERVR